MAKSINRKIVASYLCWGPGRSTCTKMRNMGITWMCEILIITLFVILMVVPLAVVLIAVEFMTRGRTLRRNRVCNSRRSILMHLETSRKVFESEICARLVGRMIGIVYWIINIIYLIKESLVVVEYYFRYLLSQNDSTAEQIQVVETVLSCLVVVAITIFFALETIVLMCITFHQEKSLLTPYICANCQNKRW